ncbi:Pantothenate precursors transporter PanS [Sinobacterium norvegicum]|uniref:Pantothenates transporter PanS n=1 Tax=Sinobacterium norvegicum TaxID=1641715 RepID=A0ABM9AHQ5_9GAMM|nr:bile acid:sodium symporter [Sinobacterium norvegicum]CAH0992660.1 Pantothenate precursors transporter PanS [Sinobacterium norvegicum]
MFELSQLLSLALILMMFAMGLGLAVGDFLGLFKAPKLVLTTVFGQLILLPIIAVAIGMIAGLTPALIVGLLLVALCPSGSTSNFLTKLGKGNAALSVTLTAVISLVTVFSLPLILLAAAPLLGYRQGSMSLSFVATVQDMALHTLLPVAAGMLFRALFTATARRIEPVVVLLSTMVFVVVIALLWQQNWSSITASFGRVGIAALAMLFCSLLLGLGLGVMIKTTSRNSFTMMLEVGIQNGALAFFIAVNLLKDMQLVAPATVYTVAMVLVALPIVLLRRASLRA